MPLGEEHLSFVDYEKLGKNPKIFGKKMTEEQAVEILGNLLPRMQVKKLVAEMMERVKLNQPLRDGLSGSWIWQNRMWQAFDAYVDNFELLKLKNKNRKREEES